MSSLRPGRSLVAALAFAGTCFSLPSSGQARLVKDIAPPAAAGSGPHLSIVAGERAFFTAAAVNTGRELWVTDGSPAGTRLVKDVSPGTLSTHFSNQERALGADFFQLGGYVYWRRSGEINQNFELWRTDGTAEGTALVLSLGPALGPGCEALSLQFASMAWVAVRGNAAYFIPQACEGQVWKLDGGTGATSLVASFPVDRIYNVNGHIVTFDDKTIRFSDDPDGGFSAPMTGFDLYVPPFAFEEGLLLLASGTSFKELWTSDGTAAGTIRRASGIQFSPDKILGVSGTKALFSSWLSVYAVDLVTGAVGSIPNSGQVYSAAPLGNSLLIYSRDGTQSSSGYRLWRTDGTELGTTLLRSFPDYSISYWPSFTAMGGRLYFEGNDVEHGPEPWVTDGTPEGTALLADVNPGPVASRVTLGAIGARLLLVADHASLGRELWISDGSPAGTTSLLANIADDTGASRPGFLTASGSRLYFQAYHPETGYEPFVSDGTDTGTGILIDFIPGTVGQGFTPMGTVGGKFFFNMRAGSGSDTLVTEGTPESTRRLGSEIPFFQRLEVARSLALDDRIIFLSTNAKAASTDGTPGGTVLLSTRSTTIPMVRFRRSAFLALNEPHTQLFRTDGTVEGTARLSTAAFYSQTPQVVDDKLFFRAYESATGAELWLTEGTAESTRLVADSNPGSASSMLLATAPLSGRLYYFATSTELWTSDGTDAGTHSVATLPGVDYQLLFSTGSRLLFFAKDDAGWELWASDGTASGSVRLTDICAGPGSSVEGITRATMIDGVLHFAADDCVNGLELWRSDGTSAGTMRATDIAPGILSSSPASFAKVGDEIYFSAYRPDVGVELFAYRPDLEPSSTGLTATPSTIALGDSVELEAVVSHSGTFTPNGAVEFVIDGEVLKTVPITGGSATAIIASLSGGAHSIVARYAGDAFIAKSTSQSASILVSARPATLSATASATDSVYGTVLSVSALVEGVFASPHFPSGVVVVREGAQQLGGGSIANGVVTITLPILSAGTHQLNVSYERDASFAAYAVVVTVNVSVLEATIGINGLPALIDQTTTMDLYALLSRANQAPLAGKLRLLDGGQLLREELPGVTNLHQRLSGLSVGTHHFVVDYVGDPNVTAASATVDVVVTNFPLLTSTTPAGICRGQQIFDFLIDGNYFDATTAVTLNSQPLTTQFLSVGQLRAFNTTPLPSSNGASLGIARADGTSKSWGLPFHSSYAAPVVTPPPALVAVATQTVDRIQGISAATSPAFAAWIDGATATDDCPYLAPERLPRLLSDVAITDTTPVPAGNFAIRFSYRDSVGNQTTGSSNLKVIPRGSLDGDVLVTAIDMVVLANHLVGNIRQGTAPFTSPLEAGDMNADGRVNSVDLVILANYLVGNITVIPAR